jgi:hypothetical protein
VAPCELDENVFQAGLAGAQVFEVMTVFRYRVKQRRDREVRFAHAQANRRIFAPD